MPLNSTTYLELHGWEGKGVPLDGKQGRGLKKPLALPMKRNLKGLGKGRDRAIEWWDCLFEASAKSINIRVDNDKDDLKKIAVLESTESQPKSKGVGVKAESRISLESQAKRELARKLLMSGFVRGKEVKKMAAEEELEKKLLKQAEDRRANLQAVPTHETAIDKVYILPQSKGEGERAKESKKDKAKRRLEKQLRKEEKQARKKRREVKKIDNVKRAAVEEEADGKSDKRKKKRKSLKGLSEEVEMADKAKKRKRGEV